MADDEALPFRAAVEAAGEAIIITSPDLDEPGPRIEYVNPAFTRMTGYTAAEVIGRSPRFLQGPGTSRAVLDRMRAELATHGTFLGEALNYRKDGTPYTVEWLINAVCDAEGRVCHWVSAQRDVTHRRRAEERHRLLLRELQHRVRNTIATVRSIARQTAIDIDNAEDYVRHLDGRLNAIARVQALVTRDPTAGVDLSLLVAEELLAHCAHEGEQAQVAGPPLRLQPRAAETIGLALHELATNSVKYGALSDGHGQVAVTWEVTGAAAGRRLRLEWIETGALAPGDLPPRKGFGTRFVERTLPYDLDGRTSLTIAPHEVRCVIELPLTERVALLDPAGPR